MTTMENKTNLTPTVDTTVDSTPASSSFLQTVRNSKAAQVARNFMLAGGLLIGANALTSCDTTDPKPKTEEPSQVDLEKQKEWAKNIEPDANGNPKVVTLPPVGNEPFVYKDFMKMELKPVNYANGTYSFTPIFSKKVIEEMFELAKELEPNKSIYGVNLAIGKNGNSSLTNSITIVTKDEGENVASVFINYLPESFTLEDIKKLNSIYNNLQSTYLVTKNDNLYIRLGTKTIDKEFDNIFQNINPLTLASSSQ